MNRRQLGAALEAALPPRPRPAKLLRRGRNSSYFWQGFVARPQAVAQHDAANKVVSAAAESVDADQRKQKAERAAKAAAKRQRDAERDAAVKRRALERARSDLASLDPKAIEKAYPYKKK